MRGPVLAGPGRQPPTALRALTIALAPATVDPYALAGGDGFLFCGTDRHVAAPPGAAWTLAFPTGLRSRDARQAAVAGLASVPHQRPDPGAPPLVLLGSFPFAPQEPGALSLPALTYQRTATGEWLTWVGTGAPPDPSDLSRRAQGGSHSAPPLRPPTEAHPERLVLRTSDAAYARAVQAVLALIADGTVAKVVLARALDLDFPAPPDVAAIVGRLKAATGCTIFSLPIASGRILGASPELLVRRTGTVALSHPLAGTLAAGAAGGPGATPVSAGTLLSSAKDLVEHRLVVEAVVAALTPLATSVEVPGKPAIVHLATMDHLGTPVVAHLAGDPASAPSALDLAAHLHPTPAVGGVPRAAALEVITRLEVLARGHWAGTAGWVDAVGDGEWVVAIRSASLHGRTVRIHAGAGIVADSDPRAEAAETALKLQTVLDPLAPGTHLPG